MDLFSDIIQAVQDDLTIGDESAFLDVNIVKRAINRAYRRAAGMFRWPETDDAKKTSTEINQEYYEYPTTWRPNSIWRVEVDDVRYGEDPDGSPLKFKDYLEWKEDNPNSTEKKWANQWRRYFINPIPTTAGDNNIVVWGQRVVDELSADGDVTIFSYSMPECNDAIAKEAVGILKSKGEEDRGSQFASFEAKAILSVAWGKVKQEMAKYEKIQPQFYVPDYYGDNKQEI